MIELTTVEPGRQAGGQTANEIGKPQGPAPGLTRWLIQRRSAQRAEWG
jgi:hypothetical protein